MTIQMTAQSSDQIDEGRGSLIGSPAGPREALPRENEISYDGQMV